MHPTKILVREINIENKGLNLQVAYNNLNGKGGKKELQMNLTYTKQVLFIQP